MIKTKCRNKRNYRKKIKVSNKSYIKKRHNLQNNDSPV